MDEVPAIAKSFGYNLIIPGLLIVWASIACIWEI